MGWVVGEQECHQQDRNPGLETLNAGKFKTAPHVASPELQNFESVADTDFIL